MTSRPRREGRRPAHITSSAPPAGGDRQTDSGQWTAASGRETDAGRRERGVRGSGTRRPRPMAGPAPPAAADELPGPARRLYSRWAGRAGGGGPRARGGRRGSGRPGTKAAAAAAARNVAGTRPPCGAAGVGAREWGRHGCQRRARDGASGGCGGGGAGVGAPGLHMGMGRMRRGAGAWEWRCEDGGAGRGGCQRPSESPGTNENLETNGWVGWVAGMGSCPWGAGARAPRPLPQSGDRG